MGFTPILAFPHQGEETFAYSCEPAEGEGIFNIRMTKGIYDHD